MSKKLSAVPAGANGGKSSKPVLKSAVSSISPIEGSVGCTITCTGPRELKPLRSKSTICVTTSSRRFPSSSLAEPSVVPSKKTWTVVDPLTSMISPAVPNGPPVSSNWPIEKSN